jgi:hypothetical protein
VQLAERIDDFSGDIFCHSVMQDVQQQGWQRRHLDWEVKRSEEAAGMEHPAVQEPGQGSGLRA